MSNFKPQHKLLDMAEGDLKMLNKDLPMTDAQFKHYMEVGNHMQGVLKTLRKSLGLDK